MSTIALVVRDETKFFEQALQEYREAVGDYSAFLDLRLERRQQILERAQQLNNYPASEGA